MRDTKTENLTFLAVAIVGAVIVGLALNLGAIKEAFATNSEKVSRVEVSAHAPQDSGPRQDTVPEQNSDPEPLAPFTPIEISSSPTIAPVSPETPSAPKIEIMRASDCQIIIEDKIGSVADIRFGPNTASITGAESFDFLNKTAAVMQRCEGYSLTIGGHTDSAGDAGYNQRLSEARAQTVRGYLAQQGVDTGRMKAAGFGETNPIATNATAQGRATNRRISFLFQMVP